MSELSFADEVVTSALVTSTKENIAARRTIVYKTLIDPTTVRIEGEKTKNKLFKRFLFKLNTPEEIQFSSIEKYYEPYLVISGKYLIDYYRKCAYSVGVDKEAKEVILGHTFTPEQPTNSSVSKSNIKLEGEERLVKETRGFITLNRYGQDSKLSEFPSAAPSEENPQKLFRSFKMPEIDPSIDVEVIRKRIAQRPNDINRIVNEELEIDERSIIYTPRFRLAYKCPRIGKEACVEFDGVTLKQIQQNENAFSAAINAINSTLRRLLDTSTKWIMKKLQ